MPPGAQWQENAGFMTKLLASLSPEFVQRYERDLYHCSSCNYCVDAVWPERGLNHVCATMQQHTRAPGYSGRGFIEAARAILDGVPLDGDALATRVFTCTTCGNCESACPIGLRPASIGQALRRELVNAGCVPEAVGAARADIVRDGNPYGTPRGARENWAEGLAPAPGAPTVTYFAGCAAVADAAEARAGHALLAQAGAAPSLGPAACCGAALAELGCAREADALAAAAAAALRAPAAPAVVAGCECRRHLAQAAGVESAGLPGWLWSAVQSGAVAVKIKDGLGRPLRVHLLESCQLKRTARGAPATDEDAALALFAALGIEACNAGYPSAYALCCGAAGGMPRIQPQAAARMARARLPAGDIAVTVDPRCAAHLRQAARGTACAVYGFAEFVQAHCTLTPRRSGAGAQPQ